MKCQLIRKIQLKKDSIFTGCKRVPIKTYATAVIPFVWVKMKIHLICFGFDFVKIFIGNQDTSHIFITEFRKRVSREILKCVFSHLYLTRNDLICHQHTSHNRPWWLHYCQTVILRKLLLAARVLLCGCASLRLIILLVIILKSPVVILETSILKNYLFLYQKLFVGTVCCICWVSKII